MREERDPDRAGKPAVGRSGARFPSPKQRDKLAFDEPDPVAEPTRQPTRRHRATPSNTSAVGRAGARFPSPKVIERLDESVVEPAPPPEPEPQSVPIPPAPPPIVEPEPDLPDFAPHSFVRPYVLTRGRTKSSRHLAIEALISARSDAPRWSSTEITGEFQSVRALCGSPHSVAEVAATLSVPLGVARVLLGDMADLGLVSVHDTATNGDGRPALALMERVLHGLRRL
jgi:hypothetical protein